jgi:hypothetical protein
MPILSMGMFSNITFMYYFEGDVGILPCGSAASTNAP